MLTWLHLSDFHLKAGDDYGRDVVLGSLLQSIERYRGQGRRADIIFATGDIAYSGKEEEYLLATKFFDDLLAATGLEKRFLYIVPGNHDIDRTLSVGLARTLASREESDAYFSSRVPKTHLTIKQRAFLGWFNQYFEGIRALPNDSTCGPAEVALINGTKLGILPLNTALFCEGDDDHGRLWLGRRCLSDALTRLKDLSPDLNIALMHHPLEWLHDFERSNIKDALQGTIDLILRGHLHETDVESVMSASGGSLHLAAGAAYQTRRWPNRALFVTHDQNQIAVFPLRYEDNPHEVWTLDTSAFAAEPNFQKVFLIPRLAEAEVTSILDTRVITQRSTRIDRYKSNIVSRRNLPFVGREKLLEAMSRLLVSRSKDSVLVLHGQPGTGKSELAREFARQNREDYPGGTFLVDVGTGGGLVQLAAIGRNVLNLDFPAHLPIQEQCWQTLVSLGSAPALLIYDNARSEEAILPWLPPSGMPCHVLITTVVDSWGPGWHTIEVPPLSKDSSLELIEALAGRQVVERFGAELAELAGGLPVEICPAASALAYAARRGRLESASITLTSEARQSFSGVYDTLDDSAQLLLQAAAFLNCEHVAYNELASHIMSVCGWGESQFAQHIDVCKDLHLVEGDGSEFRMHQLFASFLLGLEERQPVLSIIRARQRDRLIELAHLVAAGPTDHEALRSLMTYPLDPQRWAQMLSPLDHDAIDDVGQALLSVGQFEDALSCFKYAVAQREKTNRHNSEDWHSLGVSLDEVGSCLLHLGRFHEAAGVFERAADVKGKAGSSTSEQRESLGESLQQVGVALSDLGLYEEALPWFERAIQARIENAREASINHDRLGAGLHYVGRTLSNLNRLDEALPWFERAVSAKEKGDRDGEVDNESLGRTLQQVASTLIELKRFEEALPWAERSITAKERGDLDGRVHSDSVGWGMQIASTCLFQMERFSEAAEFLDRAIEAKELGDEYGRIDYESLGDSFEEMGICLLRLFRKQEALTWFERAAAAKEQGDIYGRVDNESLSYSLYWMGHTLATDSRTQEAIEWFKRSAEASERGDLYGRVDNESLASTLLEIGECLSQMEQHEEALTWFERAATRMEQGDIYGRVDNSNIGASYHIIGCCLATLERFEEAAQWLERAALTLGKGNREGRIDHESVGVSLHEVGDALASLERFEEAAQWFEQAAGAKKQGDIHGRIDNESVGVTLEAGAECLRQLERLVDALSWLKLAAVSKERGDIQGQVDYQSLGETLTAIAFCLCDLERYEEALPWVKRGIEAKEKGDLNGNVDSDSLGESLQEVAELLCQLERFEDALPWFDRAIAARLEGDRGGRVDQEELGSTEERLALCLAALDRHEDALPWFIRAVESKAKGDADGHVVSDSLGATLAEVGHCLSVLGRYEEALTYFEKCVSVVETSGVDSEKTGRYLNQVGYCMIELELYEDALVVFRRAGEASEKGDAEGRIDHYSLAHSLRMVAVSLKRLNRDEEAGVAFERAIDEIRRSNIDSDAKREDLIEMLREYADSLRSVGRHEEAGALDEERVQVGQLQMFRD